jgi:hypothetical protein
MADTASKKRTIAIWALRVPLGLAFLTIGTAKLTSSLQTEQLFAAIGWGQWFRYLTGLLDVIGALPERFRQWPSSLSVLCIPVGGASLPFGNVRLGHFWAKSRATIERAPLCSESEPLVRLNEVRLCAQAVEQNHS